MESEWYVRNCSSISRLERWKAMHALSSLHRSLTLLKELSVACPQINRSAKNLTSSHNLPPSEANTRERGVCWGHPRPRQEASPPAPLSSDCMSVTCSPGRVHYYGWRDAPGVDIHGSGCP